MNAMNKFKKALSLLLVFVLMITLFPVSAQAADSSRKSDTIFFATDRHEESSKLNSLLKALQYEPGLVVLGGDHVNDKNSGSLASITSEIQSVYEGVQTFYTYAAHDQNVSADSSNPYAYARTGEVYEGEDYYVYAVDQEGMDTNYTTAAANFKTWASGKNDGKVIFVVCHMPIHYRRKDNYGGATWLAALNEAGTSHDIVYLWGHNHTGESGTDKNYFVARGNTVTPQTSSGQGTATTINFTYVNAGYIKNGYCTMAVVNDENVSFVRYNTSGTVQSTNTMTRQFAAPAHTHSYTVTGSIAATCSTAGSVTYTCDCGDSYTETVAATGNHSYTTVTVDATCETAGSVTYTCSCGDTYTETVAALGHDYTSVTVNATCTEDGYTTYTCDCGDTYTVVIPSAGEHVYTAVTVAATCEKDGYTTYTCGCGDTYTETIKSQGHNYTSVVTAPTCEKDGYTTYTCHSCGDSYTGNTVAALTHNYTAVVTAATCEKDGCTTHTCSNCGDSYTTDIVAALGHNYSSVVTAATCEENGYTTHTCSNCGDSYTSNTVAALGHDYTGVESDGYMVYTCGNCGNSYSEKLEELVYTKVSRMTTGNSYVITVYSGGKYYALSHSNNKISATRVTVSGNEITSEIREYMLWDYFGGKLSYESNGTKYYLYMSGTTLGCSTSRSSSVSFSSSRVRMGSYYLAYSGGTIKGSRSANTAYAFEETVQ